MKHKPTFKNLGITFKSLDSTFSLKKIEDWAQWAHILQDSNQPLLGKATPLSGGMCSKMSNSCPVPSPSGLPYYFTHLGHQTGICVCLILPSLFQFPGRICFRT